MTDTTPVPRDLIRAIQILFDEPKTAQPQDFVTVCRAVLDAVSVFEPDHTPVPSVLLDQLREAVQEVLDCCLIEYRIPKGHRKPSEHKTRKEFDKAMNIAQSNVTNAARAITHPFPDAVQPTAEDEPTTACICRHGKSEHGCPADGCNCAEWCRSDECPCLVFSPAPAVCPTEAEDGGHHYIASKCRRLDCEFVHRPSCPTCEGTSRETVGMVCQTCGWDYMQGEKPTGWSKEILGDLEVQSDAPTVPRVASSLDDLRVGQVVAWQDTDAPDRSGLFRVAFIDDPEAILKSVNGGWPRISWQVSDFKHGHHLTILSDPAPSVPTTQELPTTPGSVIEAGSGGYGPDFWMLTDSARWVSENGDFARPENMTCLRVLFDAGGEPR